MKRTVWIWQFFGFAFVSLFGTLLHFAYEFFGESGWIAPLSGVNESTFEHMKLLFWPMLIFAAVESFFFGDVKEFWCIKLRGTSIGLLFIPVLFYTYNGVIGKSPDWMNISIFFVSAALGCFYEYKRLKNGGVRCKTEIISVVLLCVIALSVVVFTFCTPRIEIFRDPVTGKFGI